MSATIALFQDDPYCRETEATVVGAGDDGILLDRTVFYARGGGQPGDQGRLRLADGRQIPIVDTVKDRESGLIRHLPEAGAAPPSVGTRVTALIDWPRRHRLMRMHTCLHLLSALVPGAVTGGQVGEQKSRLDFDLPEGGLDKESLTRDLNRLIEGDADVAQQWITDRELERDPGLVKTMSVAPPRGAGMVRLIRISDIDLQACGGTHVARTGEIGPVTVTKIENKGRHNRRVSVVLDRP